MMLRSRLLRLKVGGIVVALLLISRSVIAEEPPQPSPSQPETEAAAPTPSTSSETPPPTPPPSPSSPSPSTLTTSPPPSPPTPPASTSTGRLSIVAQAGDAIAIDGKAVGIASYEGTLPSGMHVVRVTARGKKTYEQRIVIEEDQVRTLDIALEKDSASSVPPWAVIGIGAAAAATGIIVIGYFALRSDDEPQKPITGTMQPGLVKLPSWAFP